jgi:hypothetical protein
VWKYRIQNTSSGAGGLVITALRRGLYFMHYQQ